MHNYYLINDFVEFKPALGHLRNINNPETVIPLNSPSCMCLLILINKQGQIVTQHEFMNEVWIHRGMNVSSNTFYQNISILRKKLNESGLGNDVIVTIPRTGLTLAPRTTIKKLDPLNELSTDDIILLDEKEKSSDAPASDEENFHEKTCHEVHHDKKIQKNYLFLILFIFIITTLFYYFSSGYQKEEDYFIKYAPALTVNGCHLMLNSSFISATDKKKALAYGERYKDNCTALPWVYITIAPNLNRVSVVRCNGPLDKKSTCVSEYFID